MDVQPALSPSLVLSTRIGQAEGSCASVFCHKGHMPAQPRPNCTGPFTGKKTPHRWEAGHLLPAGHLAASFGPHLGPSVCFHTSLAPPGLALWLRSTVSLAAEFSVGPAWVLTRPQKWRCGDRSEGGGSRGQSLREDLGMNSPGAQDSKPAAALPSSFSPPGSFPLLQPTDSCLPSLESLTNPRTGPSQHRDSFLFPLRQHRLLLGCPSRRQPWWERMTGVGWQFYEG